MNIRCWIFWKNNAGKIISRITWKYKNGKKQSSHEKRISDNRKFYVDTKYNKKGYPISRKYIEILTSYKGAHIENHSESFTEYSKGYPVYEKTILKGDKGDTNEGYYLYKYGNKFNKGLPSKITASYKEDDDLNGFKKSYVQYFYKNGLIKKCESKDEHEYTYNNLGLVSKINTLDTYNSRYRYIIKYTKKRIDRKRYLKMINNCSCAGISLEWDWY